MSNTNDPKAPDVSLQLAALEAGPPVLVVNRQFKVVYANVTAHSFLVEHDRNGTFPDDPVGARLRDLFPGVDQKAGQHVDSDLEVELEVKSLGSQGFLVQLREPASDQGSFYRSVVDGAAVSIMATDENRVITYVNAANQELLSAHLPALQERFGPDFDPSDLVGKSIDIFHKDPRHQAGMLDRMKRPTAGFVDLGDTGFRVDVNVVKNDRGERLGWSAVWTDETAKKSFQSQISFLVAELERGNLSTRGDLSRLDGDYLQAMMDLNRVLDALTQPLVQTGDYLQIIASGGEPDLTNSSAKGDFARLNGAIQDLIAVNQAITDTARQIASGDLSVDVMIRSDQDELLKSMASMVADLVEFVRQMSNSSREVASNASEMQKSTQTVASTNQTSAASLEEISATMVELSAQTRHNASNAQEAMNLAHAARASAAEGDKRMADMLASMTNINEASKQIVNIIKVIDDIAFQTNLLALNAAVEAARAGAHGKGFAVVAEEVRNLAARSAKAAKETAGLIADSIKKVEAGTELARITADGFVAINDNVSKAAALVEEIASSSTEQNDGIEQVNGGLTRLEDIVQHNAAVSEQMAAAASELSSQAQRIQKRVEYYKVPQAKASMPGLDGLPPELLNMIQSYFASSQSTPASAPAPVGHHPSSGLQDEMAFISLDDDDFGRF